MAGVRGFARLGPLRRPAAWSSWSATAGIAVAMAALFGVTGAVFTVFTVNSGNSLSTQQLNAFVPTSAAASRTNATTCLVSWTPVASPPAGLTYDVTDGTGATVATGVSGTSASVTVPATATSPTVKARIGTWVSTAATTTTTPCQGFPGAPVGLTVTPGDTQINAAWTAPAGNGGTITSYTAVASPGGATCTSTAPTTTCTLTGLVNGLVYTVSVTATSNVGTGDPATATAIPYPAAIMTSARLRLWLDGADTATLLAATSCTGAGATTSVGCWRDKSIQANHFTQSTGTKQPALSTVNGRSVPSFDGTADALSGTASLLPNGTASSTQFVVGTMTDPTPLASSFRVALGWGATTSGTARSMGKQSLSSAVFFDTRGGGLATTGDWPSGPPAIVAAEAASAQVRVALSGGAYSTPTAVAFNTGTAVAFVGQSVSVTSFWLGTVPEVVIFTGTLTDAERRIMDEYLARKWTAAITPQAPTAVSAVAGNEQATVSWAAPAWDGGSPVTSYTVVATPSDGALPTITQTGCASSPCVVTGLTDGASYTFRVTAVNVVGAGAPSTASAPPTIPYPAALAATGNVLWLDGADSTTVFQDTSLTTPTTTAGQSIAGWRDKSGQNNHVTAPGTAPTADTTTFPGRYAGVYSSGRYLARATGFPTGSDYTEFAVYRATSACGNNILSGASGTTHAWFPQPTDGLTVWHNGSTVSAGAASGSALNTAYIGSATVVNSTLAATVDLNASRATAGTLGFSNADANIQVGAFGGNFGFCGQIGEISVFNRVLSATERRAVQEYLARKWVIAITPQAPTGVTGSAPGDAQAAVSWTAPASNGGSAITSYTAVAIPADSTLPTITRTGCVSSPCTVTGLTNGGSYTFTMAAVNALGTGPASAPSTAPVIPYPASVMGAALRLWLDGADATTMFASSACSGAAPTTAVGCWKDKSTQVNHAIQATGGNQPALATVSGRVMPSFDGSSSFLSMSASLLPNGLTASTTFVTGRSTDPSPTSGLRTALSWGTYTSGQTRTYHKRLNATVAEVSAALRATASAGSWTANTTRILADAWTATSYTAYMDTVTGTTANTITTTGTTGGRVGTQVGNPEFWLGQVPEILVFTGSMSVADRRIINEYLARKWAVAITSTAPVNPTAVANGTTGTVSWTAPAWNGGAPITSYIVTPSNGGTCTWTSGTSAPCTGLTDNLPYTFTVQAVNSVGIGLSATTPSVTP